MFRIIPRIAAGYFLVVVLLGVLAQNAFSIDPCGDQATFFSVEPLAPADYFEITPLGAMNPGGHTFPTLHTYMMLTDNEQEAAVYAPGDITITNIREDYYLQDGTTDYFINFSVCDEVAGYFVHATTLSNELKALIADICTWEGDALNCSVSLDHNVSAGTLIAYAGGPDHTTSVALDFGLRDTRTDLIIYNSPGRLVWNYAEYVVCPYDYFEAGTVKDNLFGKLQVVRTSEPVCGTVDHDIKDTAQGKWFLAGTEWGTDESPHMALVPSNKNPLVGVLSIGTSTLDSTAYNFTFTYSGQTRRHFSQVTSDGNTYCYGPLEDNWGGSKAGYIFLKMTDDRTLKLERVSSGDCPGSPNGLEFSTAALTYVSVQTLGNFGAPTSFAATV
ncbi:hypothetical protein ACFL6Y_11815, partial [Elusimicrobiota bacterium]